MKNYKWVLIVANLALLLFFVNWSVANKEKTLKNGRLVLLKLAPVDPRSLMQGDYMRLNYDIASLGGGTLPYKRGYIVVNVGPGGVAEKVRLQEDLSGITPGQQPIKFTLDNFNLNIGASSFFFQEGQSEKYAAAQYGGLRVDAEGNSLLFGLYDSKLKKIE